MFPIWVKCNHGRSWHEFYTCILCINLGTMKDILYILNSLEEFYGETTLTSVIQADERVSDLVSSVANQTSSLNGYEVEELSDRINKLITLNARVREEFEKQSHALEEARLNILPFAQRQHTHVAP